MLYAISLERPRLGLISRVHETFRTPWVAILIHTGVAIPLALGGSFAKLAAMSAVARMTTYLFTCAAIPRLRKLLPGGFRAPGGLLFPGLGVLISVVLFATLKQRHLVAAAVALTVGALLYWISKPAATIDPGVSHGAAEQR
jgi:amino acid transporter